MKVQILIISAVLGSSVFALAAGSSLRPKENTSSKLCRGNLKCAQPKVEKAIISALSDRTSELRKRYEAEVSASSHFECFGEMKDPVGETLKDVKIALIPASSDDETEGNYSDAQSVTYTQDFVAAIPLPADCNEGGIVHNWYPKLLVYVSSEESYESNTRTSATKHPSFKVKIGKTLASE